ncbi:DddA-like double-stranded DNA deaminase toxin [Saccharopolyspora cebuensis]|uniref:DddA-like double-stranded DNA deaminase toxin n=1 Tax=Saccharopolyspora cebuensis TaxID=418759 RepID=A0ABV4CIF3_9PSEU
MSVEEVDRTLATAVGKLDETAGTITAAALACAESRDALHAAITGTTDPEALDALGAQGAAAEQLDRARAQVKAIREQVERYRRDTLRPTPEEGRVTSEPPDRPAPRRPPNAVGVDGSEYPADAAADVVNLPARVEPRSGQRTVGQVTLNGRPVGEMRSGNDAWSASVSTRLKRLGIALPRIMHAHAEMKLAAMMIDTGIAEGMITINNAPCGSQPGQTPGCHQTLERFLPDGSTLTVRGTTEQGKPFSQTYRGKAT